MKLTLAPQGLPGKLIVFSGVDGSGKSTLVNLAIAEARLMGRDVVQVELLDDFVRDCAAFREYAHDPIGSQEHVDLLALSLLCAGNRLQNLREKVVPALARGAWVFCDRYIFTTWAEFDSLRSGGAGSEVLRQVLEVFLRPDLAVLPFASAETCLRRVRSREDEQSKVFDPTHFARRWASYRAVAAANEFVEIGTDTFLAESVQAVKRCLATLECCVS